MTGLVPSWLVLVTVTVRILELVIPYWDVVEVATAKRGMAEPMLSRKTCVAVTPEAGLLATTVKLVSPTVWRFEEVTVPRSGSISRSTGELIRE